MDAWIEFLLNEVESVKNRGWAQEKDAQRAGLIDAFMTNFKFPVESRIKGYVVGTSSVRIPRLKVNVRATTRSSRGNPGSSASGSSTSPRSVEANETRRPHGVMLDCIEVVPEGWTDAAYDLLGGLFVPCERKLEAGSVISADIAILDPKSYIYRKPGFACEPRRLDVLVAVEA
ncbi:MAG: hypothetical protein HY556_09110 [Euryarchaeota archaeon]|nr:hypothetical protein [Euryarchaeota archaeon]